jgi:hypothetical protein
MDGCKDFMQQGYVVARNMFSKEDMALFVDEVKKAQPYRSGPDHLDRGALRFYSNLFCRSAAIRAGKVFIEAGEGDVVLFSSYILHRPTKTRSRTRAGYVAEFLPLNPTKTGAVSPRSYSAEVVISLGRLQYGSVAGGNVAVS